MKQCGILMVGHQCLVLTYRPATWGQSSISEVGAAEVPKVRDHEEGIANIRRRLEEPRVMLLPGP